MPGRLEGKVCVVSMQPCHLDDPADCQALIELELGPYGRFDVLFNLTRAAWPHLKASRGVVVNMASLNASLSFKILSSLVHTKNKAGIIGMTRQLALEGREHGIRANLISPVIRLSEAT